MEIVSLCPLTTGSLLWQQRQSWVLTVVCKATYALQPGESPLAPEQEPVNESDRPWSDELQSLYAASDLVPAKPRAEVLLVGQAYAPEGAAARSLVARLTVGDVDKSVEIRCDRTLHADGSVREGSPFTRMPLLYERAAGGPGTYNPVGMSLADCDAYGSVALPNLQVPGTVLTSSHDVVEPIGFGPIPSSWPLRQGKLGRHASSWSPEQWSRRPLPDDVDRAYFNAAPPDQQLSSLREDEHLFLDNLHPDLPRLATHLPGVRPVAFVERRGAAQELALHADTLWIDTARLVCTLVWRGHVTLERALEQGRVLVAMAQPGETLAWADLQGQRSPAPESTAVSDIPEGTMVGTLSSVATALPFRANAPAPAPASRWTKGDSGVFGAPAPAPVPVPAPVPLPVPLPAPPPRRPDVPAPPPMAAAPPIESPWASGSHRAVESPSSPALAIGTVGTVGAVAVVASVSWSAPLPAPEPALRPLARPGEAPDVLQLLWYDAGAIPRMRRVPRWQPIFRDLAKRPLDRDLDDPALAADPMELEDRREVFELLARGEASDAPGVSEALADAVRDDGKFVPPLVLLAGELQLPFDELETLKATVTTVSPLVGQDEALKVTVDAAKDFLQTPGLLASPGVADGLTARIKEAFGQGKRVVPQGYLDAQTERVLLEKRHYQKREVLGAAHLRGLLQIQGGTAPIPVYMVEDVAKRLPMFQRFKVRLVAEAQPTVDQYESHAAALKVMAIVRVTPPQRR